MITEVNNKLVLIGLFIGKYFLLKMLLRGVNWLPDHPFIERYPKFAWLPGFYIFSQIIFGPFSMIVTGRSLQSASALTFFVFLVFVPIISVDILKAGIEIAFNVSSYFVTRGRFLKRARQRYFTYDVDHVRLVGFVRLGVNVGLLMAMIYAFL